MKNDNLVLVSDYFCNPDICKHCYAQELDSIKMAEAFVVVGGKQFVDFTKYDFFISDLLGRLKDKADNSGSPSDAYEYVSVATGFFDTRHDFISHLSVALSDDELIHPDELKRMFDHASPGYRILADHMACANELLFRANQNACISQT